MSASSLEPVPAEGEDPGEAEVLPERPQADLPQGPLRRDHLVAIPLAVSSMFMIVSILQLADAVMLV
jgi:hypothetical protein